MTVYRIKDWDDNFENNRTRDLKVLNWVPVPNKHDGDGYTVLVDHENGAAHLGAWLATLQIASRCEIRGTLLRQNNKPHDSTSLARMSKLPKEVFDEVLPRLIDDEIGWMEVADKETLATIPHLPAAEPHDGAVIPQSTAQKGREGKGKKGREGNNGSGAFDDFWKLYPKKIGKQAAMASWKRQKLNDKLPEILSAIQAQKESDQWKRGFIPHPTTWLNQGRWEDDVAALTGGEVKTAAQMSGGYGREE